MVHSVEHRIEQLTLAIQRRRMEQAQPVDELSQSLRDFAGELRQLDSLGRATLLGELNRGGDTFDATMGLGLSADDLEKFINGFMEKPHIFLNGGR